MTRILITLAAIVLSTLTAGAANPPQLKFNKDGKFKIVQFTDIHWNPQHKESYEGMDAMLKVLDTEKPDFVIYTGDNVTGYPVKPSLDVIFQPVIDRGIPFAFVFGNHDSQYLPNEEAFEYMKQKKGNLTGTVEGIHGVTNFALPVLGHNGKPAAVVYGFDSNHNDAPLQDGIYKDQIDWYKGLSEQYTRGNDNMPLPSIAFFHIPAPEWALAISDPRCRFYGVRKESYGIQRQKDGIIDAFITSGDVMAAVCGHDHLNDFAVCWQKRIMLCYGRVTGSHKTSHYNMPNGSNGAMVFELTEGVREYKAWIRLRTGEKIQSYKFPFDFIDD